MSARLNHKLLSDPKLLKDFHAGKNYAFETLFRYFFPMLALFATKMLADEHSAQDIAQDALIKVWKIRDNFETLGKIKSFLFTCVKNDCLKQFRKDKLKDKYKDLIANETFSNNDMLGEMIQSELVIRLFQKVNTLPEQCRKIIYLIFQEEKTPAEIAALLKINVSTVNSQKMRGLQILRERLGDKEYLLFLVILIRGYWF